MLGRFRDYQGLSKVPLISWHGVATKRVRSKAKVGLNAVSFGLKSCLINSKPALPDSCKVLIEKSDTAIEQRSVVDDMWDILRLEQSRVIPESYIEVSPSVVNF